LFFFSSRRRHTRFKCDWSSDVCSSDLPVVLAIAAFRAKSGDGKNNGAALFVKVAFQKWTPSWFDLALRMNDFEAYNRPELARVRSEERRVGKERRSEGGRNQ